MLISIQQIFDSILKGEFLILNEDILIDCFSILNPALKFLSLNARTLSIEQSNVLGFFLYGFRNTLEYIIYVCEAWLIDSDILFSNYV